MKITFEDKEQLITNPNIPRKNKVVADDVNEIKRAINDNDDNITELDTRKADRTEIPTNLNQLSNADTKFVNETQMANAVQQETTAYNNNAINKTNEFNTNAINKTTAFNENATSKTEEFDEHVEVFQEQINGKVDKETGKGLSTNDYTNEEKGKVDSNTQARHTHTNKTILDNTTASFTTEQKGKLEGLENYDDTEIKEDISELQNDTLQILEEEEVEIYD